MYQCAHCSTGHDEWRTNCINCGATLKTVRESGFPHESFEVSDECWPEDEQPNGYVRPLPPPYPGQPIRSGDSPHLRYLDWDFIILEIAIACVAIMAIAYFL